MIEIEIWKINEQSRDLFDTLIPNKYSYISIKYSIANITSYNFHVGIAIWKSYVTKNPYFIVFTYWYCQVHMSIDFYKWFSLLVFKFYLVVKFILSELITLKTWKSYQTFYNN